MTQSPDMSNDTARQIEEMARLFVESAVEVLGGEGAGTFDTMKPHEREECMKLMGAFHTRLLAAGYTKPAPAARVSAEETEAALKVAAEFEANGPIGELSRSILNLAAALRAERETSARLREALEPFKREADGWPKGLPDSHPILAYVNYVLERLDITLGDLRRAARELDQPE